jgi:ribonuclease HI
MADKRNQVRVYTDGACRGNPGPGGYGLRIRWPDGRVKEYGGAENPSTNNRMELKAVIEALRLTQDEEDVLVVMDSEYVRQGITSWLKGWKARGWITATKKPVRNQDLWKELDQQLRPGATFGYTAGHAGDPDNERVDRIAVAFAANRPLKLEDGVDHTPFAELKSKPKRGKGPAVYLSFVNGKLERHATWGECESRVKGRPGALFKKCMSAEEESQTLKKWGLPG